MSRIQQNQQNSSKFLSLHFRQKSKQFSKPLSSLLRAPKNTSTWQPLFNTEQSIDPFSSVHCCRSYSESLLLASRV